MAQLVEHILGKDEVPGSNPGSSSKKTTSFGLSFFYALKSISVSLWLGMAFYRKFSYNALSLTKC